MADLLTKAITIIKDNNLEDQLEDQYGSQLEDQHGSQPPQQDPNGWGWDDGPKNIYH